MQIQVENKRFRFCRVYNKDGQKVDTMCFVKFDEYSNIGWAFAGMAKLHPSDRSCFNKGVGKLVALRHALDNLNASEETCFWAEEALLNKLPKLLPSEMPTGVKEVIY